MRTAAHAVGVLVAVGLGLVGMPVGAAPPAPAAPQKLEGELLVWSGGKTREEAKQQQEALSAYLSALKDVLVVKPAVLESAKVEGLKPGFFIVALGLCPSDQVQDLLSIFQALYPDVYTRTVKYLPGDELPRLECPKGDEVPSGADEPVLWGLEETQRVTQKGNALVGLAFSYRWDEVGDFASSYFAVKEVYLLIDTKTRRLVASKLYDGPSDATTLESFTLEGDQIVSTLKYGDPRCSPGEDRFMGWRGKVMVSLKKDRIELKKAKPTLLEQGSCGYADEARMVGGEDVPGRDGSEGE